MAVVIRTRWEALISLSMVFTTAAFFVVYSTMELIIGFLELVFGKPKGGTDKGD